MSSLPKPEPLSMPIPIVHVRMMDAGFVYFVPIRHFRGRENVYQALIMSFVESGYSFAVYGGYLYLSANAAAVLTP